jgi:glucan biosynthesis protein C
MYSRADSALSENLSRPSIRLHYLDWLRVLAVLGVFLFHAVHPFDFADWHIKNAERSMAVTVFLTFLFPWGMPFFFLIAGTGSWFALRRRSARQFALERVRRLLVPYIAGCILLWPGMLYFQWRHLAITHQWYGSFRRFVLLHRAGFSPMWFGEVGFHLWFLGFLFSFSLLALPLFAWLRGRRGQAVLSWLARTCARRGGILWFLLPLLLVRLGLQPLFPEEHDWGDFFYLMTFFVSGYLLFAHPGFARAIRRDWAILLAVAVITTIAAAGVALAVDSFDMEAAARTPQEFLIWALVVVNGWSWTTFMLYVGMRYLDFTNRVLQYGQQAVLPFFLLHQPVIIAIAFYVVQWDQGIPVKLAVVLLGSFAATMAIYELVIRRVGFLRFLFGMKAPARPSVLVSQEMAPATLTGTPPPA